MKTHNQIVDKIKELEEEYEEILHQRDELREEKVIPDEIITSFLSPTAIGLDAQIKILKWVKRK